MSANYNSLRVFILLFAAFCAFAIYQNDKKLIVKGKVTSAQGKAIAEAKITLHEKGGAQVASAVTDNRGRYSIPVPYDKEYNLYYEAKEHVSMFLEIDAFIPPGKENRDFIYSPRIVMEMETKTEYNLNVFARKPLTRIKYDETYDQFIEDLDVLQAFIEGANEPEGLVVLGKIYNQDKLVIPNAEIKIIKDDTLFQRVFADDKGAFEIKVPYLAAYKMEVSAPTYTQTLLEFDAELPESSLRKEFIVEPQIQLATKQDFDVNLDAFKMVQRKMKYDEKEKKFVEDVKVNESFLEVLNEPKRFPITVEGQLIDKDNKGIPNVTVVLKEKNKTIVQTKTDSIGIYTFKAPPHKELMVKMEAKGFESMHYALNTHSEDENKRIGQMQVKAPNIEMFKRGRADINPQAFKEAATVINVDPAEKLVVEDSVQKEVFTVKLKDLTNVNPDYLQALQPYPANYQYLNLKANVVDVNGKKMENARVSLKIDGFEFDSAYTDKKGRFIMRVPYDRKYELHVGKEDFHTLHMIVDSKMPDERKTSAQNFEPQFQMIPIGFPDINPIAFERPFTRLKYNPLQNLFVDDSAVYEEFMTDLYGDRKPPREPTYIAYSNKLITEDKKDIRNAKVFLKEDSGNILDSTITDRSGNFSLKVPYNKQVRIIHEADNHFRTFVELDTRVAEEPEKNDTILVAPIALVSKDVKGIDPQTFNKPVAKLTVDPVEKKIVMNEKVRKDFEEDLVVAKQFALLETKKLTIDGRVKSIDNKNLEGITVFLKENNSVIDSTKSDRRGRYAFNLAYKKNVQVAFASQNHYEAYYKVNTEVPIENVKEHNVTAPDVKLVEVTEKEIDKSVLTKPIHTITYNPVSNSFIPEEKTADVYYASLLEPKRIREEKEKEEARLLAIAEAEEARARKVTAVEVKESKEKAPKKKEDAVVAVEQEVAVAKKKEQSQSDKSESAGNINNSMANVIKRDTALTRTFTPTVLNRTSISNIQVQNISLAELNERTPPKDENVQQRIQETGRISELAAISSIMKRKGNASPIAVDSVLKITPPTFIYNSVRDKGVYFVEVNKVISDGKIYEFAHVINWFKFNDYYINGNKISAREFNDELNKYKEYAAKNEQFAQN
jgi:hypothetical protein